MWRKPPLVLLAALLTAPPACHGQVGGNANYGAGGGRARAEQAERARRAIAKDDQPPSGTSTFVEASVMMNVRADEYVAIFALVHEADAVAECNRKMDATVAALTEALKPLGVRAEDVTVDFAAQTKVYGFEFKDDVAREKRTGFELKKNVAVRYTDRLLIDKLVASAAQAQVFDLVKVDYVVKNTGPVQDRLMEEAGRLVRQKAARYEKLLGVKLGPPAQVYAERYGAHYPTRMYDAYTAAETEDVSGAAGGNRQRYTVHGARKSRTFYYNALDGDGFDVVINPVVTEPVVQFTLYLKVRCEAPSGK